jgi:hypothetical protein
MPEGRSHLSCHERGRLLLIPVAEVLYLKADLKYVTARTREREYLLDESLTHLETEFAARFIRLHRSVLVAKDRRIVGFEKRNTAEDADTYWLALIRDVAGALAGQPPAVAAGQGGQESGLECPRKAECCSLPVVTRRIVVHEVDRNAPETHLRRVAGVRRRILCAGPVGRG